MRWLLGLALAVLAQGAWAEVQIEALMAKRPPKLLSETGIFTDMAAMTPAPGLVGYDLATPLFTDYADKTRYIYTPDPAPYQVSAVLEFPVGSVLVKTFHYGAQKVETRLLVHRDGGWAAYPYVWTEDGQDARLKAAGADLVVQTDRGEIAYRVPNMNQCKSCHVSANKEILPIGPKLRNLNHGDQLARLVAAGVLAKTRNDAPGLPVWNDPEAPLEDRARAYLDANCAHCHAPGLPADTSALYLNWEETRPAHLGIRKTPVAAGRGSGGMDWAIAPGAPDQSFLLYRLASDDPGIMMPELGRGLVHEEGVALIREWIASLD